MSDDPRMQAAVDVFLDVWFHGVAWRSGRPLAVDGRREDASKALQAALAVLERREAPAPPFPTWSPATATLLLALGRATSDMAVKSDRIRDLRHDQQQGATTAAMLDGLVDAAFPGPAREG